MNENLPQQTQKTIQGIKTMISLCQYCELFKNKIDATTQQCNEYIKQFTISDKKLEKIKESPILTDEGITKLSSECLDGLKDLRKRNELIIQDIQEMISMTEKVKIQLDQVEIDCRNDDDVFNRRILFTREIIERKLNHDRKQELAKVDSNYHKTIEQIKLEQGEKEKQIRDKYQMMKLSNRRALPVRTISNPNFKDIITSKQKWQLEQWINRKCSEIIFNSEKDCWAYEISVLNEKIIGKEHLVFLIEDDQNQKFGYYLNSKVIEEYATSENGQEKRIEVDNNSFQFSLESVGRFTDAIKCEIIDTKKGGYNLYTNWENNLLISFGDIMVYKQGLENNSYCIHQDNNVFDYHGKEKVLCDKVGSQTFNIKKFVVIQMK